MENVSIPLSRSPMCPAMAPRCPSFPFVRVPRSSSLQISPQVVYLTGLYAALWLKRLWNAVLHLSRWYRALSVIDRPVGRSTLRTEDWPPPLSDRKTCFGCVYILGPSSGYMARILPNGLTYSTCSLIDLSGTTTLRLDHCTLCSRPCSSHLVGGFFEHSWSLEFTSILALTADAVEIKSKQGPKATTAIWSRINRHARLNLDL